MLYDRLSSFLNICHCVINDIKQGGERRINKRRERPTNKAKNKVIVFENLDPIRRHHFVICHLKYDADVRYVERENAEMEWVDISRISVERSFEVW